MCSTRRRPSSNPNARIGTRMNKRLIWVDGDDLSGWCCSECMWGLTAPRPASTVAALAFSRFAQESFEKHNCGGSAMRANRMRDQ
jgi:hypothetical protein